MANPGLQTAWLLERFMNEALSEIRNHVNRGEALKETLHFSTRFKVLTAPHRSRTPPSSPARRLSAPRKPSE